MKNKMLKKAVSLLAAAAMVLQVGGALTLTASAAETVYSDDFTSGSPKYTWTGAADKVTTADGAATNTKGGISHYVCAPSDSKTRPAWTDIADTALTGKIKVNLNIRFDSTFNSGSAMNTFKLLSETPSGSTSTTSDKTGKSIFEISNTTTDGGYNQIYAINGTDIPCLDVGDSTQANSARNTSGWLNLDVVLDTATKKFDVTIKRITNNKDADTYVLGNTVYSAKDVDFKDDVSAFKTIFIFTSRYPSYSGGRTWMDDITVQKLTMPTLTYTAPTDNLTVPAEGETATPATVEVTTTNTQTLTAASSDETKITASAAKKDGEDNVWVVTLTPVAQGSATITLTAKNSMDEETVTDTFNVTAIEAGTVIHTVPVNYKSGNAVIYTDTNGTAKTASIADIPEGDEAEYTVPEEDMTFDGYLNEGTEEEPVYNKYQFTYDTESVNSAISAEDAVINLNYTKKAYKTVTIKYVDKANNETVLKEQRTIAEQLEGTAVTATAEDKAIIEIKEENVPKTQYVYDSTSIDSVTVTANGTDDVITLKFNGTAYIPVTVNNTVAGKGDPIKTYTDYALNGAKYTATVAQLGYKLADGKYYFPKADAVKEIAAVSNGANTLNIEFAETDKKYIIYEDFENITGNWDMTKSGKAGGATVENGRIRLTNTNTGSNAGAETKTLDSNDNKIIKVSFDWQSDIQSGNNRKSRFNLTDGSENIILSLFATPGLGSSDKATGSKAGVTYNIGAKALGSGDENDTVAGTQICAWNVPLHIELTLDFTGDKGVISGTITGNDVDVTIKETAIDATDFTVIEGEHVYGPVPQYLDNFSIEDITPAPKYVVSGMADEHVTSVTLKNGETTVGTATVADGAFSIADVAAGEYTVEVAYADGYEEDAITGMSYSNGKLKVSAAVTDLAVTSKEIPPTTYTVSGTADEHVTSVTLKNGEETVGSDTVTDEEFSITGVPAGEYTVEVAYAEGYEAKTIKGTGYANGKLTVSAAVTDLEITSKAITYTVSGTADEHVTSVTLERGGSAVGSATVVNGAFSITGIPAGEYTVEADCAEDYEANTITSASYANGKLTVSAAVTDLRVTSTAITYPVMGSFEDATNIIEIHFEIEEEGAGSPTIIKKVVKADLDLHNGFVVQLPKGTYNVHYICEDGYKMDSNTPRTITVSADDLTSLPNLKIVADEDPRYTIKGSVDAHIAQVRLVCKRDGQAFVATPDENGVVTFNVPDHEYTFTATYEDGYELDTKTPASGEINVEASDDGVETPKFEITSKVKMLNITGVTAAAVANLVYTGEPQDLVTVTGADLTTDTVEYKVDEAEYAVLGNKGTAAKTYTVTVKVTRTGNYNVLTLDPIEVTIAKATAAITAEATQSANYDGTAKTVTASLDDLSADDGAALTYAITKDGETVTEMVDAGVYTVVVSAAATTNCNAAESKTVTFTINKADITGVTVTPASLNGTEGENEFGISDINVTGADDCTVTYSFDNGDTWKSAAEATDKFTTEGTYTIKVKVSKGENYNDLISTINVTIAPVGVVPPVDKELTATVKTQPDASTGVATVTLKNTTDEAATIGVIVVTRDTNGVLKGVSFKKVALAANTAPQDVTTNAIATIAGTPELYVWNMTDGMVSMLED